MKDEGVGTQGVKRSKLKKMPQEHAGTMGIWSKEARPVIQSMGTKLTMIPAGVDEIL